MSGQFEKLKTFLRNNANIIQKEATRQHKKYLGTKSLRNEYLDKYQEAHTRIVKEVANYFDKGIREGVSFFKKLGETIARNSVRDGLTLEEAIDGTLFLKQAIWFEMKKGKIFDNLTTDQFYETSQNIGVLIDTLASKIAFTYHGERQYIENNLRYLAEASRILSSSLDYETTLNTIAKLAVPQIADWCAIDILEEGTVKQVAVAHKDPKKVKWAKQLRKVNPVDLNQATGTAKVLRTGEPEFYPVITDEMLVKSARSKDQLKLVRQLEFKSAMIVPISTKDKPIGTITFVTTETNRHYTDADLLMARELATRASVAIENASLYRGSQEAISIRDEFISVASHELKTPVTSVKMFTQVLKKHSEQIGDSKAVEHLSKMDKQINKLTELIYDLLNVSKIQAGKMEFSKKEFDFDTSVKEIIDILQPTSDKHKLILKGKTGKTIYGDEERIGQVINNLISNAIKYSPRSKKIIIKLSTKNDWVKVDITDFGIGMAKAHLPKIFERFYRVYDNNDKTFPGLGIGLYICSEIIKRHGGKFGVESNLGQGSTFSFSLPIKNA